MIPGRKPKGSLEVALQRFGDLMSGPALREIINLKRVGEVVRAVIGDGNSAGVDVASDKKDVWVTFTDILTGMQDIGRLFIPAGILWRAPSTNDAAHVVRGRKMRAPGGPLVMPDGGNGATAIVPDWFPDEAGLYEPDKDLNVHAKKGDVILTSDTANARTVQANGTDSAGILDALLSDLADALGEIPVSPSTTYPGLGAAGAKMSTLLTKLGNGSYKSTKFQFGK